MATIVPVITQAGLAAAIAAHGLGLSLKITHVVLGAAAYDPTGLETAPVARREKAVCSPGSSGSGGQIVIVASFTTFTGTEYDLGEILFYAGDPDAGGVLFAVASEAGSRFAVRIPGSGSYTTVYTISLSGVPEGSVTVQVDPNAGVAADLLQLHRAELNPHPQYDLPVGAELSLMRRKAPRGFLTECGSLVSRVVYADLLAMAIAEGLMASSEAEWAASAWTMFGPGDGVTTFRLPDKRSEFDRPWDNNRGIDPGRLLGSPQEGQNAYHEHLMFAEKGSNTAVTATSRAAFSQTDNFDGDDEYYMVQGSGDPTRALTGPSGGSEAKPRNAASLKCIKAGPSTLPAGPEPSVAAFSAAPLLAEPGKVEFTESCPDALSWRWDFGDGTSSTARNPTKNYTVPGVYTVRLTIRNAADIASTAVAERGITVVAASSSSVAGGSGSWSSSVGGTGNIITKLAA